jgi:hypothetical protein
MSTETAEPPRNPVRFTGHPVMLMGKSAGFEETEQAPAVGVDVELREDNDVGSGVEHGLRDEWDAPRGCVLDVERE